MKYTAFAILLTLIIGVSGCGKKDTTQKTQDSKTQEMKKEEAPPGKLPDYFPQDIPLYKDAKIISTTKEGIGPTAQIEINDKPSAVGEFYKTEMPKNGYKADDDNDKMMKDDRGILTYRKEGRESSFMYTYNKDKSKTILTISTRTLK